MNPADIAFIIICTGLVMLMTPGLALFYGGLVRSRNVLSTTMHSFITMGIVPVLWFVVGYSLAFGPDLGGIIGGFSHVLLRGVDMEGAGAASGIPPLLFMLFQCMFAVLTLALISGSYAERIHFPAMLLFSILWLLFVYCHEVSNKLSLYLFLQADMMTISYIYHGNNYEPIVLV